MKNILLIAVLSVVIVGTGAFFGGMQYAKSQNPNMGDFASRFGNMDPSQRPGMNGGPGGFPRGQGGGGGLVNGKILSLDSESITLELPDGGSKLVFFSNTSKINKMTEGSSTDLTTGTTITVTGTSNDDGSMTASTIQILPEGFAPGAPPASATAE